MRYRIVMKGPRDALLQECKARKITLEKSWAHPCPQYQETFADVSCALKVLSDWYCDPATEPDNKGFKPGTLLFWAERS